MKEKEILNGIDYRYNKTSGKKEKIIHIKVEPTEYCQRCGKKDFLNDTFRYWVSMGGFEHLCKDCVTYYKDVERKNHPEMAKYVDK